MHEDAKGLRVLACTLGVLDSSGYYERETKWESFDRKHLLHQTLARLQAQEKGHLLTTCLILMHFEPPTWSSRCISPVHLCKPSLNSVMMWTVISPESISLLESS